jgi:membrane-bound lytic murein transglycosylase A
MFRGRSDGLAAVALAALLAACAQEAPPKAPELRLAPMEISELPGWDEDTVSAALPALLRTCERFMKQDPEKPVGPEALGGTVADWKALCEAAARLPAGDDRAARAFFAGEFRPYAVSDGDDPEGLFTGYFEPELQGSRVRDGQHAVPLYARPDDLITVDLGEFRADLKGDTIAGRVVEGALKPYYSYEEIDEGALADRGLEIAWVADPIDAFFLHIQGSGRVRFGDGEMMRVGYAAKNGRPFVAIGKTLLESGELTKDNVSMQSIRDWLRTHPDRAKAIMYKNPSYIFYRVVEGDGPIGAQGVALTPGRSLAVDRKLLALGLPIFLDTTWPPETPEAGRPFRRLMIAQDTGGAIKGAVRGDIFFGTGEAALEYAGRMKQKGRYYLFLPRAVAERRDSTS